MCPPSKAVRFRYAFEIFKAGMAGRRPRWWWRLSACRVLRVGLACIYTRGVPAGGITYPCSRKCPRQCYSVANVFTSFLVADMFCCRPRGDNSCGPWHPADPAEVVECKTSLPGLADGSRPAALSPPSNFVACCMDPGSRRRDNLREVSVAYPTAPGCRGRAYRAPWVRAGS